MSSDVAFDRATALGCRPGEKHSQIGNHARVQHLTTLHAGTIIWVVHRSYPLLSELPLQLLHAFLEYVLRGLITRWHYLWCLVLQNWMEGWSPMGCTVVTLSPLHVKLCNFWFWREDNLRPAHRSLPLMALPMKSPAQFRSLLISKPRCSTISEQI